MDIGGSPPDRTGREDVLTWGDLGLHEMESEKSAEAIVATGNEPIEIGGLTPVYRSTPVRRHKVVKG